MEVEVEMGIFLQNKLNPASKTIFVQQWQQIGSQSCQFFANINPMLVTIMNPVRRFGGCLYMEPVKIDKIS